MCAVSCGRGQNRVFLGFIFEIFFIFIFIFCSLGVTFFPAWGSFFVSLGVTFDSLGVTTIASLGVNFVSLGVIPVSLGVILQTSLGLTENCLGVDRAWCGKGRIRLFGVSSSSTHSSALE